MAQELNGRIEERRSAISAKIMIIGAKNISFGLDLYVAAGDPSLCPIRSLNVMKARDRSAR
jgi:hypothetical protein